MKHMNNYYFRPFQALPQQIPGGLRGAIFEDENGDFNIYINQDLCDERKLKTIIHERLHAERGDTRSGDLAEDVERYLNNELELVDLQPRIRRSRSEHPGETVEEFEDRMFQEHGVLITLSHFAKPKDLPGIEDAILRFIASSYA